MTEWVGLCLVALWLAHLTTNQEITVQSDVGSILIMTFGVERNVKPEFTYSLTIGQMEVSYDSSHEIE